MTVDDFRRAMNTASRDDALCYLMHGSREVVALGYDSGTGEAILFPKHERVPIAELREGFE